MHWQTPRIWAAMLTLQPRLNLSTVFSCVLHLYLCIEFNTQSVSVCMFTMRTRIYCTIGVKLAVVAKGTGGQVLVV